MSNEYLERLYSEYRRAAKIGQDVMDRAASDNRDMTADELTIRDAAFSAVTSMKAEIDKVSSYAELRNADPFASRRVERASGRPGTTLRDLFQRARDNGFAAVDYNPTSATLTTRALQSAGGSAIETSFADFVTVYARTNTPMLNPQVVQFLDRPDGSPLVLPRLTADPNHAGTVTAEAAGVNELDATLSSVTLNPYKFAITNLYSAELAQDSAIPLEQIIGESTARELAIDIGAVLTTGDGSAKPQGFVPVATNAGTAAGTGATYGTYFGFTDLVTLFYSLPAPTREKGSWQANATTLAAIRNSRDTAGNHIWQPAMTPGEPETLLGKPIYENPAMANGSAAKAVAFGDFSKYVVAAVPLRVEASIHYKYNTDQVALRSIWRVDGDLISTSDVAVLVNAAV